SSAVSYSSPELTHTIFLSDTVSLYLSSHLFFFITPPPPRSTLFPYTTLFRSPKKTLDVLAGNNGVQILLNIRYRVGLAPPAGFMAAGDSFLEIAQGTHLFGQMLPDAPDLPSEQGAAAGDDDRALAPKDLLLGG